MARIKTYNQDVKVTKDDKLIGTNTNSGATQNFSLSSIVDFMNSEGQIKMPDGALFRFQTFDPDHTDPVGILNLTRDENTVETSYSAVTTVYVSKKMQGGDTVGDYINAFDNGTIKISEQGNLNSFGIFLVSDVVDDDNDRYTKLTLTHDKSVGTLYPGKYYYMSFMLDEGDINIGSYSVTDLQGVTDAGSGRIMTVEERGRLASIEDNATQDQSDQEIETAYNNQVSQATADELTNGTETEVRRFSPANIKSMIDEHANSVQYVHNQSLASTTWTINHNLGKFPAVSIKFSSSDQVYTNVGAFAGVTYTNENSITINLAAAESGYAYLN